MYVNEPADFLSIHGVISAIRRQWFGIGLLACVAALGAAAISVTLPNVYQSESMLYIKIGRGTVSLDPATTASGSHISLMDSRQSEINSVREMLGSRVVVERAIKSVGVDRVMEKRPWYEAAKKSATDWFADSLDMLKSKLTNTPLEEVKANPAYAELSTEEVAEREALEEAVERVFDKLYVKASKDSYTLLLVNRAFSPTLARDLCQAIVDEYRKVHVEAHSVHGSLDFFEQQYNESQKRLAELENRLRDHKNRSQMMTISGKQDLVLQEIKQLQSDFIKVQGDIAAARARDVELVGKIEALPERMDTQQTEGVANQATERMRNQLFELEMLEKDLTNKYNSGHPLVAQVRDKLIAARKIFDAQDEDRTLINTEINPVRQELELDRFRNLSTLEGLKAQHEELSNKLISANIKAEKVNSDEILLNDLERQVNLARSDVMTYGKKQEEARLLDQLDNANLSDVSVPQPPSLVLEKVGPKRALIVFGSALAGVIVGCLIAVYRDTTCLPNRPSNDLNRSMVVPSASVPVEASAVAGARSKINERLESEYKKVSTVENAPAEPEEVGHVVAGGKAKLRPESPWSDS